MRTAFFFLILLGTALLGPPSAGQSQISVRTNQFGRGIDLHLKLHSLGRAVFPDHYVETSDDLKLWRSVAEMRGGINIWPVTYQLSWNTSEPRQFFRLRQHLNVTGADLSSENLAGQNHRGAKLPWAVLNRANLTGTDFREANLQYSMIRSSQLSGANFQDANLCYADLAGSEAGTEELKGAALLNTRMPDASFLTDDLLAEALALDLSSELTAPIALYLRLRNELRLIRAIDPNATPTHPRFEWGVPNGLHVSATPQQFAALNASELGPVSSMPNRPERVIFAKRFHPRALASVLRTRFRVSEIEPFGFFPGSGPYASAELTETNSTYRFAIGSGDCPSGCLNWYVTRFSVNASGEVTKLPW